jgi:hypothetical protein
MSIKWLDRFLGIVALIMVVLWALSLDRVFS